METYTALKPFLFAAFLAGAMGMFGYSVWRIARLIRLGKERPGLFDNPVDRIGDLMYFGFGQKKVVAEKFGWNHFIIFWSFMIITVGHGEFILRGVMPTFSLHFLGDFLYGWIVRGGDFMAFFVLFAVSMAIGRRLFVRPWFIDYESVDAFRILGMITTVMVTYFLAMGAGVRASHVDVAHISQWFTVSNFVSGLVYENVTPERAAVWYEVFWWAHAGILMTFLNYIPYSKHVHLLGALPNIYLREKVKPRAALSTIDFEASETYGVGKVSDFTWKALLDTYACTECGRCDKYCPANNTGKPLKPQKVIHDIKDNLKLNGTDILESRGIFAFNRAPDDFSPKLPLIAESQEAVQPGQTSPEVLWSCTTCGACVQACPVLIDHVDAIVDMRRHLTMTEGAISSELALTYKNIENNYNPWGIGADKRADWAEGMGLKFWGSSEDADKYEYLFWVGCAGSFDARAQKTAKAFTRVLDAAGITYAILGQLEKCTGDPLRRTGNEYAFATLAAENVTTLNDLGVKKIVTACPHCLNTLRNEYPAFGGKYDVIHHSQLIAKLLSEGRLAINEDTVQKVTFHDPCYLGRWNNEYEAPRQSLSALRHLNVVEMELNKTRSFCCGAGGGQMWMEEQHGTARVNQERTRQALEVQPDAVAVACPFCMTMLEDGVKAAGREEDVDVLDIAEIVAMSLGQQKKPKVAPRASLPIVDAHETPAAAAAIADGSSHGAHPEA